MRTMIQKGVEWLEQHRAVNVLIVIVYTGFLLFAHDVFVNFSVTVMDRLSLPIYEKVVGAILALVTVGIVASVVQVLRQRQVQLLFTVFLVMTLGLLVVHFFVLTEMNIEFIHAIMYGLLAAFLFPLVGRSGAAVIIGLPAMLLDEWYQHVVLFPHYTTHLEFNDVVLDLLGAGFFVSILGVLGVRSGKKFTPFWKRVEVWICVAFAISVTSLMVACVVVPYPVDSCENTWLILNKLPEQEAFWYVHPTIGSTLHVLKPVEGLVIIFVLCIAFLGLDLRQRSVNFRH